VNFYDALGQFGQAPAFILEDGETVSYAAVADAADTFGANFKERALVFLLTDNCIESVIGYLGCLRSKQPMTLLARNIHPLLLGNLLKVYGPHYIWLPRAVVGNIPDAKEVFSYGNYVLLERAGNTAELHKDLALLVTTSGSTGSSKFVRLSYDNLASNTESIAEYLKIGKDDRAITILPMHYVFGLSIINSHLQAGAAVILTTASVLEKKLWNLFRDQKATSISGVPYTYEILKRLEWHRIELPTLRVLTQAGGKLSAALVEEYVHLCRSKGLKFYVMYGAAEATARMSYLPPDVAVEKPASIGVAIPGGEFWLEDENGNRIADPEVVGELFYRGRNVSLGYAQSREDLSLGDERKGVLRTGDMARRDKEGLYYIAGRKSRFVKLFGNRVNLDELEQLIREAGIDCACKGDDQLLRIYITNAAKQDEIVPFVQNLTGLHKSGLKAVLIEKIPRNEAGKILYSELP
jgi:Acyl-CoA synthetases (AMP-forming)/AMP-acid ligases II